MKQAHININTEIASSDVRNQARTSVAAHINDSEQVRVSSLGAHNIAINVSSYDANQFISLSVFITKDMVKQLVYDLMKAEQESEDKQ